MRISLTRHLSSLPVRVAEREGFFQKKGLRIKYLEYLELSTSQFLLQNNRLDSIEIPIPFYVSQVEKTFEHQQFYFPLSSFYMGNLSFFSTYSFDEIHSLDGTYQLPVPNEKSVEALFFQSLQSKFFKKAKFRVEFVEVPYYLLEEYLSKNQCLGFMGDEKMLDISSKYSKLNLPNDKITKLFSDKQFPCFIHVISKNYLKENPEQVISYLDSLKESIDFLSQMSPSRLNSYLKVIESEGILDQNNLAHLRKVLLDKKISIPDIFSNKVSKTLFANLFSLYTDSNSKEKKTLTNTTIDDLYSKLSKNTKKSKSILDSIKQLTNHIVQVQKYMFLDEIFSEGISVEASKEKANIFKKTERLEEFQNYQKTINNYLKVYQLKEKTANLEKEKIQNNFGYNQEEIKNVELAYKKLFNGCNNLLLFMEKQTYIVLDCNKKFLEETGYQRKDFIGRKIYEFMKGIHSQADFIEIIKKNDNTNYLSSIEFEHKEGHYLFVDISFEPSEIGQENSYLVTVINTSENRETMRLKHQFISSVSHELRSPMTSIKGFFELLSRDVSLNFSTEHRNYLNTIFRNINRMNELIENLLKLDVGEDTSVPAIEEQFFIEPVIREVIETNKQTAIEKGLSINDSLDPTIQITTNRSDFIKVISNLVVNAIKYTPTGYISIKLKKEVNNLCLLTVTDTGIGIDPKYSAAIFEKFFRVPDSNNKRIGGTGLGLSIAQSLILKMGGNILLDTDYKKGTKFLVYLPMTKEHK